MKPHIKSYSNTVLSILVVLFVLALHMFMVFWLQRSLLLETTAPSETSVDVSWIDGKDSAAGEGGTLGSGRNGEAAPLSQVITIENSKVIDSLAIDQEKASEILESAQTVFVKSEAVTQPTVAPVLLQSLPQEKASASTKMISKEINEKNSQPVISAQKEVLPNQKRNPNKAIETLGHTNQKTNHTKDLHQKNTDSAIPKPASNGEKEQALVNTSETKNTSAIGGEVLGTGSGKASSPGAGNSATLDGLPSGSPMHLNSSDVRFKNRIQPIYPQEAQLRSYQGEVVIFVIIDQKGQVKSKRVQKTSGYRVLDEAALNAAQRSSYYPHVINGQAREVQTTVNYQFKLGRK